MKKLALLLAGILLLACLCGCHTDKGKETKKNAADSGKITARVENEKEEDEAEKDDAFKGAESFTVEKKETEVETKTGTPEQASEETVTPDITYLFKGGQPDGEIDVSRIKTVAFYEAVIMGDYTIDYCWHICLNEKKANYIYGYGIEKDDFEQKQSYSMDLTNEYIANLRNVLEKSNLHKWKAEYKGEEGEPNGEFKWRIGIELTDGTVYSWTGGGVEENNRPAEYDTVKDAISYGLGE